MGALRALRREMPDAIDNIRKAGVGPVDMQQSVIGPGMGVFSRHAKVLEDDDSAMPVKTALSLINFSIDEIINPRLRNSTRAARRKWGLTAGQIKQLEEENVR